MEREEYKKAVRESVKQKGFYFVDEPFRDDIVEIQYFVDELNKEPDAISKKIHYEIKKGAIKTVHFIYDSNNFKPVRVRSVCEFLREVYKYKSKTVNRYFRGEKAYYKLLPSLFRYEEWVENEMELNARIYNDRPGDFADCHSTFDKLVKLKHYVHPSRLLDISTNPLVALFFACDSEEKDKNAIGVVLEAYCKKDKEKFSVSSDTVVMLTAMTNTILKLEDSDRTSPLDLPCRKRKELSGEDGKFICPKKNGKSCYYKCWPNKNEENVDTDKQEDVSDENGTQEGGETGKKTTERPKLNDVLEKDSWARKYIGELCHQCKKEGMSIYWDDVCFNELNQCILVKPPLNNDRIVRQQGCFIMCGMNPKDIHQPPESLYSFFKYPNDGDATGDDRKARFYYVLTKKDKDNILNELKVLGLDEYYFFPEPEREIKVVRDSCTAKEDSDKDNKRTSARDGKARKPNPKVDEKGNKNGLNDDNKIGETKEKGPEPVSSL